MLAHAQGSPLPEFSLPEQPPRGLLVSMAMRLDHSFCLPAHLLASMGFIGQASEQDIREERERTLGLISETYALVRGLEGGDALPARARSSTVRAMRQLWSSRGQELSELDARRLHEEMSGFGFWRPERDERYGTMMGQPSP